MEIIEKTEIIEKVIEPQNIIIQTPTGSEIFRNDNTESSATSKYLGNDELTVNGSVSSDLNIENDKDRVIGSRSVNTFTSIPSNLNGFGDVVSGWEWHNVDADKPSQEFCYIHSYSGNNTIRYELAIKENGQIFVFDEGNIRNAGLNNSQVATLITAGFGFVIGALWVSVITQMGIFPFVNTLGAILAPVFGIMISDYYINKKQKRRKSEWRN